MPGCLGGRDGGDLPRLHVVGMEAGCRQMTANERPCRCVSCGIGVTVAERVAFPDDGNYDSGDGAIEVAAIRLAAGGPADRLSHSGLRALIVLVHAGRPDMRSAACL